ncbi:MAG: hypothetical protein LJE85_12825 [Gammaproteobacteria bacterium]|nr:hypothetical protein [Gammaproteobacteria bacterium]
MPTLASQPQSIGKVLDDGFKFYLSNVVKILPLSFLAVVTPVIVFILFLGVDTYFGLSSGQLDLATTDFSQLAASFGLSVVIAMILAVIFYAAMFYKLTGEAQQRSIGMGGSLGLGLRAAIPLLITGILYSLAVGLGMVLLVIPGIILMVSLVLYMPAFTMDNAGIIGSLKKSHDLVWGNWWRTLLILSVPVIILIVIMGGFGAVIAAFIGYSVTQGEADILQYQIMLEVAQYAVNVFLAPLFPALMIILYNDLKLRKEGADLDAKIGGTPSA